MCFRAQRVCTECRASELSFEPCDSFLKAEDPSNIGDHLEEVREAPIWGECMKCAYLRSALCQFIMGEQAPPEVLVEQELAMFEQMTISASTSSNSINTNTDQTRNEENSEPVDLSAGSPGEGTSPEEVEKLAACLSWIDMSE